MEERRTAELLSDFDDYEIDDVAGVGADLGAEDDEAPAAPERVVERRKKSR